MFHTFLFLFSVDDEAHVRVVRTTAKEAGELAAMLEYRHTADIQIIQLADDHDDAQAIRDEYEEAKAEEVS